MRLLTLLFFGSLMVLNQSAKGFIIQGRCQAWGDSLNAKQAVKRWNWAKKCDKKARDVYQLARRVQFQGKFYQSYPVYGKFVGNKPVNPSNWKAPINPAAACTMPAGYELVGVCRAGCFTPDQMILFKDGYQKIGLAEANKVNQVMAVTPNSVMSSLRFQESKVGSYLKSMISGKHDIYHIKTQNNGYLKVTEEHPLVDGNGVMRRADSLKVGESLTTEFGDKDAIVSIEKKEFVGKVYNVEIDQKDVGRHRIIAAQGFLSGDLSYQNEGTKFLNKLVLRVNLPSFLVK